MEQINTKKHACFFIVSHITKERNGRLIYGIRLNDTSYFLSKTPGINDAMQLDVKALLDTNVLKEIGLVLTTVELKYKIHDH